MSYFKKLFSLLSVVVISTLLQTSSLHAEASQTAGTASENTKACDMDEATIKNLAQKALVALTTSRDSNNKFQTALDRDFKSGSGICNYMESFWYIDGGATSSWDWGDYDVKGAELAPAPYNEQLKNVMKSIDYEDTDYDIQRYKIKNRNHKNDWLMKKQKAEATDNAEEIAKAEKEIKRADDCAVALNNIASARESAKKSRTDAHVYLTSIAQKSKASCKCNEDGTLAECTVADDSYVEDHVDSRTCKELSAYMEIIGSNCLTCPIFEKVLSAVQSIATGAFDVLNASLSKLLGVAFALYLGYETILLVGSPATQKLSKYLTSIIVQGFKVTVAILLLSEPDFIYGTLISPIIESGIDFGMELSDSNQETVKQLGAKYTFSSGSYIPSELMQIIVGSVEAFNLQAATMPAIGQSMMCNAWIELSWFVFPDFVLLIEGLVIYIFGMGIILSIGFYLLDCTIQLGIVCGLLPFFVASWPFKITSKYTKSGWEMIMNTFFNFVMMGVVITAANEITLQALSNGIKKEELADYLNTNNVPALKEAIGFGGLQMIVLVVCCMIVYKLIKDTNSLANKFAGGAGINMGAQLGGTAASIATSVGKAAARTGGKAVKGVAGSAYEASGAKGAVNAGKTAAKNFGNKIKGKMGAGKKAQMRDKGRDKGSSQGSENKGFNQ